MAGPGGVAEGGAVDQTHQPVQQGRQGSAHWREEVGEQPLVDFMCSDCRGSSMGLTLFMLSLFFASRADVCCVNNHISNMISLNVELLKSAVI